jgi:hypothetical protein
VPVNIIVGLVALLVALVLYTIAVWGAFRAKAVTRRHIVLLWVGVGFDVLATAMMAVQIGGFGRDLHTVVAMLAWAGMVAASAFATWAVGANERARLTVSRWMVAPWAFWVVVFVYGMVDRGARRIGG